MHTSDYPRWPHVAFPSSPRPVRSTHTKLSISSETERVKCYKLQFLTMNTMQWFIFVVHIMFSTWCAFWCHTFEPEYLKYYGLPQLNLFHMLAHPHLNPSHHQVYFYPRWHPSAHSALYFTYSLCSALPPHHHSFTFPHQLKSNSLLLCFSRPLSSLYDFPHPCQSL